MARRGPLVGCRAPPPGRETAPVGQSFHRGCVVPITSVGGLSALHSTTQVRGMRFAKGLPGSNRAFGRDRRP